MLEGRHAHRDRHLPRFDRRPQLLQTQVTRPAEDLPRTTGQRECADRYRSVQRCVSRRYQTRGYSNESIGAALGAPSSFGKPPGCGYSRDGPNCPQPISWRTTSSSVGASPFHARHLTQRSSGLEKASRSGSVSIRPYWPARPQPRSTEGSRAPAALGCNLSRLVICIESRASTLDYSLEQRRPRSTFSDLVLPSVLPLQHYFDTSLKHTPSDKPSHKAKGSIPPSGEMEPSTRRHPSSAVVNRRGALGSHG